MSTPEQNIEQVKLTPQQARFVAAYIRTGNATEAAKAAGCRCKTEESFRSRGSQLLKELDFPIQAIMAEAGLTSLAILRTLAEGLSAKQIHIAISKKTGQVHKHETPDWGARARFTDMALKLKNAYPKKQMELELNDRRAMPKSELQKRLGALEQKLAA